MHNYGFSPRDDSRYGNFKVNIPELGDCIFSIDVSGFGERFMLYQDDEVFFDYDTEDNDYDNPIETDTGFSFGFWYNQKRHDIDILYTDLTNRIDIS